MSEQLPIDFLPPLARRSDPQASHDAARDATPRASRGRVLALCALETGPKTDFELASVTGWQQTSIGKRRGECMKAGLVEAAIDENGTTITREAPSGSRATVWRLTARGRQVVSQWGKE